MLLGTGRSLLELLWEELGIVRIKRARREVLLVRPDLTGMLWTLLAEMFLILRNHKSNQAIAGDWVCWVVMSTGLLIWVDLGRQR